MIAIACVVLAAEASAEEVHSRYAALLPGVAAEDVLSAVADLLQAYERPALDANACQLALAADE